MENDDIDCGSGRELQTRTCRQITGSGEGQHLLGLLAEPGTGGWKRALRDAAATEVWTFLDCPGWFQHVCRLTSCVSCTWLLSLLVIRELTGRPSARKEVLHAPMERCFHPGFTLVRLHHPSIFKSDAHYLLGLLPHFFCIFFSIILLRELISSVPEDELVFFWGYRTQAPFSERSHFWSAVMSQYEMCVRL